MRKSIFNYRDYKAYLKDALADFAGRGARTRLAEFIGCQQAYVSQVLGGESHFSPEQTEACSRFLGHSRSEGTFLLHLVSYARASTRELKAYYRQTIEEMAIQENQIGKRLDIQQQLSDLDKAVYYSSWEYAAVHMACMIESLQTKEALAEFLEVPLGRIHEILKFMVRIGLLEHTRDRYRTGKTKIHVGPDSPFLSKHHTNWRIQCLRSLDAVAPDELHYTSVISCAEDDIPKIREILMRAIAEVREVVRDSKDETVASYNLDLFHVRRKRR